MRMMLSPRRRVRLFLAAAFARARVGDYELPRPRPSRLEPRQERFFDRPFKFLVRTADVLVPVRLALGDEAGVADPARERREVEAAARAMRN